MSRRRTAVSLAGLALMLFCLPRVALAQNAEISGVVRDASGGGAARRHRSKRPVRRSSRRPARCSPTGRASTGSSRCRPGAYKVTFTLAGFGTVVRDGVALTASFTATINATMSVGALQETVTVSGPEPARRHPDDEPEDARSAASCSTSCPPDDRSRTSRSWCPACRFRSATAATSAGRTATCGRR